MNQKFDIKKANLIVVSICMALLLALTGAANALALHWGGALDVYLGRIGETGKKDYTSSYSNEALEALENETAKQMTEEGIVLLENNGALPLGPNAHVSLFGYSSVKWISGASTGSNAFSTSKYSLKDALEAHGIDVNAVLWDFYDGATKGRTVPSAYTIAEIPWSEVEAAAKTSFDEYRDAAVIVLSRSGTEGEDMPTDMSEHGGTSEQHFLQLADVEKELIRGVRASGFDQVILVLNTGFTMQMDFMLDETLRPDACLICPPTGNAGIFGLGSVLSGTASPSGHLVDTLVYDLYSAPSMQNFGNYIYTENGEELNYRFVAYAEGIYVGYRYYETRYEDTVMKTENVGDYDYAETVAYPFGYGLSYTEFQWSNFKLEEKNGQLQVSVDVANVGETAGKDVVQVYVQSPYTEYDRQSGIEKAAVSLVGFAKTKQLSPKESTRVTISFNAKDMLKSYDSVGGSYILENGDYLVTAAGNAHEAADHFLTKKGYALQDDAGMTAVYTMKDGGMLTADLKTGATVTNQFDFAREDVVYLSRSDWSVLENGGIGYATGVAADGVSGSRELAEETKAHIRASGWEASGRPESANDNTEPVFEQDNGLKFADMKGADYNDARWELLLNQTKVSELHKLFNRAGYLNNAIESIEKPLATDLDGPSGLRNHVSSWTSFHWPAGVMLAQTWNLDLAQKMGELVGEDSLRTGVAGWYAPAVNIHRAPFCGRNPEYYSEDPLVSGLMGANEVKGANTKGIYCYVKHFALNNQETNRRGVCTWANEQTIRELYLRAFELCVKEGNAHGIMAAMNRIGYTYTQASYALLTNVLRGEWGFEGAVITDYTSNGGKLAEQSLAAGCDLMLSTTALKLPDTKPNYIRNALKEAAHHTCYMVSTSNIMNSLEGGVPYEPGFPVYIVLLIAVDALVLIGVLIAEILVVRAYKKSRKLAQAMNQS